MVITLFAILLAVGAPSTDVDGAKQAFVHATKLFNAGKSSEALPHFRRAYELSGRRPSTIFGLAQCERALGHDTAAIEHFKEYLATGPKDAEAVRATIKELEDRQKDAAAKSPPPAVVPPKVQPPPPPEPQASTDVTATPVQSETPLLKKPWFWVVAGVVIAGSATALIIATRGGEDLYGGTEDVVLRAP